ncbi:hypothetical protein JCM19239_6042 [Vibrio variabilis]|uniref:Uncharacterized protein n=1 Tax=Vibrio variabilis TaxID=990271 RepID=A0ABQ0JLR6_9VIBR|nr:hypothetical protein JCM19239_6042 [Vibrio variabilis]
MIPKAFTQMGHALKALNDLNAFVRAANAHGKDGIPVIYIDPPAVLGLNDAPLC